MSLASRVQPHVPTVTGKRHQATVALKALIDPPGNFTSLLAGSALLISNSGTWSITCTGQILPYGLVRNTIFNKSKTCSSASFTLPSPFSAVHGRCITVNRCAALFSKQSNCQQGVSKKHIRNRFYKLTFRLPLTQHRRPPSFSLHASGRMFAAARTLDPGDESAPNKASPHPYARRQKPLYPAFASSRSRIVTSGSSCPSGAETSTLPVQKSPSVHTSFAVRPSLAATCVASAMKGCV